MIKFSLMITTLTMGMMGAAYADHHYSHSSLLNSWTGIYAGVETGVAFNNVQLRSQQLGLTDPSEKCNINSDFSTFFPGIQLGYLYQFPNFFVSGLEANISFNTNQKNTLACTCANNPQVSDRFSFSNQMQSSIKGRVGRALNWNKHIFLPYVTAGANFSKVGLTYQNEGGDYYSKNSVNAGWLIGAGIEWAFLKNWSLRIEYFYINNDNTIKMKIPSVYGLIDPNGKAHVDSNANNIMAAINYWI